MSELPGMWEESDLSGGWADSENEKRLNEIADLEDKFNQPAEEEKVCVECGTTESVKLDPRSQELYCFPCYKKHRRRNY